MRGQVPKGGFVLALHPYFAVTALVLCFAGATLVLDWNCTALVLGWYYLGCLQALFCCFCSRELQGESRKRKTTAGQKSKPGRI